MTAFDLLVRGARVVSCADGELAGATGALGVLEGATVAVRSGRVVAVDTDPSLARATAARVVEGAGGCLLPGLVDPHTHLVFAGSRIDEFTRRMAGASYASIAAAGGGIQATVRATRAASAESLFTAATARALEMRTHGTTSIEVKSGYGLSSDHELTLLGVGRRLAAEGVVNTTTTLLGAHALPPDRAVDRETYAAEVAGDMLARAAASGLCDSVDAYLDEHAFGTTEIEPLFARARALGLGVRGHVGQFRDVGGAELLARHGALSADHLEVLSDAGARALAAAGTTAVLLPGAWRTLRQRPPDTARLRAAGLAIAIGTDANPGTSPCLDLPLCAALAVRDAGLTAEEAILGITRHAARAAGFRDAGRIAVGLRADFALYSFADPRTLAYALGGVRARAVILDGRVVHEEPADIDVW